MGIFIQRRWVLGAGVLCLAVLAFALGLKRSSGAFANDATARAAGAENRAVSFLKEVRPILAQHCFQCHGPDEATRKGKLRLDLKDNAFAGREGKHVIAPGDLEGSLAWERITTDDEDERMPPEGNAEPLTQKQIATLKTWIEQGARWEDHWSFLPPKKPALPKVSDKAWVRDPLDAFVLARLDREHLKTEHEATREAWLRRASFDLTGLPPTPAEIDEFLSDKRTDAYETQTDRLLKSKRFGERQAQEWLDLARYADTSGYQNDTPREIWKWREWVINALQREHALVRKIDSRSRAARRRAIFFPHATLQRRGRSPLVSTVIIPPTARRARRRMNTDPHTVVDRVNTTWPRAFHGCHARSVLSATTTKYDPLSQRDYYSFYSFPSTTSREPRLRVRQSAVVNSRP